MLTSGQGNLSFVGFSSLASAAGGLGFVPVVTGDTGVAGAAAAEDYALPADIRLLLTKLTKKDPVTRTKALQELLAALGPDGDNADGGVADETAWAVLAHWCRLYTKLCLDTSRQVRQHAHTVMGLLGKRAKKKLVPYLESVAGPWLAGRFDPSADAGGAAKKAFETVFNSTEKQRKTTSFCSTAIVKYAASMLLQQTPDTLCDGQPPSGDPYDKTARSDSQ